MIIYHQVNFKYFNSLKINTKVNYLFEIENVNEIKILLLLFKFFNLRFFIIGNGSKIMFKNDFVKEPVILISSSFKQFYEYHNMIIVSSGYHLKDIIIKMAKTNKGGFETLYSIPASVGGAIYMNASNSKSSISDYLYGVISLDLNGNLKYYDKTQCNLSYRNSIFKSNHEIIIYAFFEFIEKEEKEIYQNIKKELIYRMNHQPSSINTCGSLFKNPFPYKVYELIKNLKKDYRINDAAISSKHLNFLENKGYATGKDVDLLIQLIKKDVYEKYQIVLEEELNILK